ncbi:TIGR02611 family protein [Kitasatospora purpeofusca]|uniref:TIGR02611 family protein n=1 Tax=Kitasatospora purpeofusca TaxID=67352 RepID=UPI002A59C89E|nr:TIGR02611 family protein [Kitasatospora purpeofusca]MDY0816216.1 TIGR02611 family protein [Kitasatospora purpeofusca]
MTVRSDKARGDAAGNTGTGDEIVPDDTGAPTGSDDGGGDAGTEGAAEAGADGGRPLGSRAPRFIRRSRPLHLSWQVAVFLVGLAVVALGVVMLPLPGPGWVVIFLGMGIWATEFVWAQLALRWTRRKVAEAAHKALDPKVRRRNLTLTAIGLVLIAALGGWYLWKYGLVMPWKIHED